MRIVCEFCPHEVNPSEPGTYQYTKGWVKNRSAGGGHAVALPEREPRFAHGHCIERVIKGWLVPGQTSLLDDAPAKPPESQPTNASFSAGMLVHICNVCGADAPYGVGVGLRAGDLGLWYCVRHRPANNEEPF